jgi:ribosomal protein S12 methylthiotransferase accessory factor
MRVYFPGGKKVYAEYKGFTHQTDQPVKAGGDASSPAPFDLFLASLGTCAGIYVAGFCEKRGIDPKDIEILQTTRFNPDTKMIDKIDLEIKLPEDFPEKYSKAVVKAAMGCAVKKHIEKPPEFNVFSTFE